MLVLKLIENSCIVVDPGLEDNSHICQFLEQEKLLLK